MVYNKTEFYIAEEYVGYMETGYYNPWYDSYDNEFIKIKNKIYRVIGTHLYSQHYSEYSIYTFQMNLGECEPNVKYPYYNEPKIVK
jgi:hypothetical protein